MIVSYDTLSIKLSRFLISRINQTVMLLRDWFNKSGKNCLRKDYKELVALALLFLKGVPILEHKIDPGACHHAR